MSPRPCCLLIAVPSKIISTFSPITKYFPNLLLTHTAVPKKPGRCKYNTPALWHAAVANKYGTQNKYVSLRKSYTNTLLIYGTMARMSHSITSADATAKSTGQLINILFKPLYWLLIIVCICPEMLTCNTNVFLTKLSDIYCEHLCGEYRYI